MINQVEIENSRSKCS